LATLRADGFSTLACMIPDEAGTRLLRAYEKDYKIKAGKAGFVATEAYSQMLDEIYNAHVQAKRAQDEPLRDIEKKITGLEDLSPEDIETD
jgi:hypothetical protein